MSRVPKFISPRVQELSSSSSSSKQINVPSRNPQVGNLFLDSLKSSLAPSAEPDSVFDMSLPSFGEIILPQGSGELEGETKNSRNTDITQNFLREQIRRSSRDSAFAKVELSIFGTQSSNHRKLTKQNQGRSTAPDTEWRTKLFEKKLKVFASRLFVKEVTFVLKQLLRRKFERNNYRKSVWEYDSSATERPKVSRCASREISLAGPTNWVQSRLHSLQKEQRRTNYSPVRKPSKSPKTTNSFQKTSSAYERSPYFFERSKSKNKGELEHMRRSEGIRVSEFKLSKDLEDMRQLLINFKRNSNIKI